MTEPNCATCGKPLRADVAAGLCPRCLLLRSLAAVPAQAPRPVEKPGPLVRRIGPYEVLDEIARGGMGIVFRARDSKLGREVALKLVRGGEWASGELLERFRTEARAAASLQHPHIVPVFGFGEDGGNWYIAMRLIGGGSLAKWGRGEVAKGRSGRSEREVALVLLKLAEAVQYAHQRGVLHRDLKPENVLMDEAGEPFLTDFGLARLAEADARLTRSYTSIGTPAYVAPEVARGGSSEATVQSDVYGLGAILYELLTGRVPFTGATPLEVLRQVADADVRRPSTLLRTVDRDLETICLKAIAKLPKERYADCGALAGDLRRWLDGEPIEARAVGPGERAVKWMRRRPLVAGLLGLLAMALLVITVGSWVASRNLRIVGERQRQSLVQFNVDSANRLAEQRDSPAALKFALDALRMDSVDPERERMHRVRLGLTLRDMPTLERHWRHEASATTVIFDAEGRRLLTGSIDGTARFWDVDRTNALLILRHPAPVRNAFLSPDGRSIVTQCSDGRAHCWDVGTGAERFAAWPVLVQGLALPMNGADLFTPDGSNVVTVVEDRVEIRNLATGQLARPALVRGGPMAHAAFSRDGKRLVTTAEEGEVSVWSLEEDGGYRALGRQQHTGGGNLAAFSPAGDRVLSLGIEPEARLWDALTGRMLAEPLNHSTHLRMAQALFNPSADRLLTVSYDNTVRLWDGTNGNPLIRGIGHPMLINAARWDAEGRRIATASHDGTVSLWDAATGRPLGPGIRHGGYAVDTAFSPSGDRLATVSQDGGVRLWRIRPRPVGVLRGPESLIPSAGFNEDGTRVGIARGGPDFEVRDSLSGGTVVNLRHSMPVRLGAFEPGGSRVVTASKDGGIHVWEVAGGRELQSVPTDGTDRLWLAFGPVGGRFVTANETRARESTFTITLWTLPNLTPTRLAAPEQGEPRYPEFSPDGRYLLAEAGKGRLQMWDLSTGRSEGAPLVDAGRPMARGCFSPDGAWMLIHEADRSFVPHPARLRDARTLQPVGPPLLHTDSIVSAGFASDGTRLATGGQDARVRIWSVPAGESLVPPMPHEGVVMGVRFTQDGRILATATRLGAVRLWDARTGQPLNPSYTVTGGVAAMTFVRGNGPFVVVGGDGSIHRWDLTPSAHSLAELESQVQELNGGRR